MECGGFDKRYGRERAATSTSISKAAATPSASAKAAAPALASPK